MAASILFLFPTQETAAYARNELHALFPDIAIDHCASQTAAETAAAYAAKGVGIAAARGGIAHALHEAKTGMALVDIPVTAFEIIKAVNRAKVHGKRIAVLAHAQMVIGIDFLAAAAGGEVRQYAVRYNQNYDTAVREAVADGAEVVIGGALACEAAKRLGVPYSMLEFGKESLLQAAKEARQIQEALEADSAKRLLFGAAIESAQSGVVVMDAIQKITEINRTALRLLGKKRTDVVGRALMEIAPQLAPPPLTGKAPDPQRIVSVNGGKVICEFEAIRHNNKPYGAVLTLRTASNIQKMEALLRKDLYARGHVAKFRFADVVGESPVIREAVAKAEDYAKTNSSVLLLGETGTGKEVFAQSIHNASARADGPFVAINCAAIPTHLLESELFGYVGGAFTGASKEGKPGLLEVAHGGTIFLDEMAEMDYANQGRLLRFYQERSVVRLGSYAVTPVDVRVIVATNKNLEELVAQNKFRDDLYYRLNVLRLELPPLRQRKSDVVLYAKTFLQQFSEESGKLLHLSPDALYMLEAHPWPGNVRECRNIMERLAARAKSETITAAMLREALDPPAPAMHTPPTRSSRQKQEIALALEQTRGNYGATAKLLGIDRSTLYRRMKRLGIS